MTVARLAVILGMLPVAASFGRYPIDDAFLLELRTTLHPQLERSPGAFTALIKRAEVRRAVDRHASDLATAILASGPGEIADYFIQALYRLDTLNGLSRDFEGDASALGHALIQAMESHAHGDRRVEGVDASVFGRALIVLEAELLQAGFSRRLLIVDGEFAVPREMLAGLAGLDEAVAEKVHAIVRDADRKNGEQLGKFVEDLKIVDQLFHAQDLISVDAATDVALSRMATWRERGFASRSEFMWFAQGAIALRVWADAKASPEAAARVSKLIDEWRVGAPEGSMERRLLREAAEMEGPVRRRPLVQIVHKRDLEQ